MLRIAVADDEPDMQGVSLKKFSRGWVMKLCLWQRTEGSWSSIVESCIRISCDYRYQDAGYGWN